MVFEEVEEGVLFWAEGVGAGSVRGCGVSCGGVGQFFDEGGHGAGEVGVEDGGVDIAFAADGGGVAEALSYGLYGVD